MLEEIIEATTSFIHSFLMKSSSENKFEVNSIQNILTMLGNRTRQTLSEMSYIGWDNTL